LITNIRLDPFERTGLGQSMEFANFFLYEFWRFTFVQQEIEKFAKTFIAFPPIQPPASFNLEALKAQIQKAIQHRAGA
jgi:hypothetical protein